MDSGDEVYGASDVESHDLYSYNGSMDDDGDYDAHYNAGKSQQQQQQQQQNYTILSKRGIRRCQDEDITTISTLLSVSRAWSIILMCQYNWRVNEVQDAWFTDEEKVRRAVGMLEKPVVEIPEFIKELTCRICLEIHPLDRMAASVCGHLFCVSCFASYISTSINDGPGCLMLQCPDPSCGAAINQDLINQLVSEEDKKTYSQFLLRSYVEGNRNRKIKWCPAPGCVNAVEFAVGSSESFDVTCQCSYSFCWSCTEETHRPVDCSTVAKWILKNSNGTEENANWLLAYTKPCPKCKRPIEKNNGCMHMTCGAPCRFEFCWLCLAAWSVHKVGTCNGYNPGKQHHDDDDVEMARKAVKKYSHYYERWASNQSSRQKALADLHQIMQTAHVDNLRTKQRVTQWQIEFIEEAWLQIVECRRVLKWTYTYGYYLPEDECAKKELFEYLQGEAELALERLHYCLEKELQVHFEAEEGPTPGFKEFRTKLIGLTKVTQNYFDNLVQALENGLSEVVAGKKKA